MHLNCISTWKRESPVLTHFFRHFSKRSRDRRVVIIIIKLFSVDRFRFEHDHVIGASSLLQSVAIIVVSLPNYCTTRATVAPLHPFVCSTTVARSVSSAFVSENFPSRVRVISGVRPVDCRWKRHVSPKTPSPIRSLVFSLRVSLARRAIASVHDEHHKRNGNRDRKSVMVSTDRLSTCVVFHYRR